MYQAVQTEPKTQFGGLKGGLAKFANQLGTDCDVSIPAIAPKPKGNNKDTTSFKICILFILFYFVF